MDRKFSVVVLENLDVYGCGVFGDEDEAVAYFKDALVRYTRYEQSDIVTDVFPGLLKKTIYDSCDKTMSVLLCGLSKERNMEVIKEIEQNN